MHSMFYALNKISVLEAQSSGLNVCLVNLRCEIDAFHHQHIGCIS